MRGRNGPTIVVVRPSAKSSIGQEEFLATSLAAPIAVRLHTHLMGVVILTLETVGTVGVVFV